jgi:hypothetical protein
MTRSDDLGNPNDDPWGDEGRVTDPREPRQGQRGWITTCLQCPDDAPDLPPQPTRREAETAYRKHYRTEHDTEGTEDDDSQRAAPI